MFRGHWDDLLDGQEVPSSGQGADWPDHPSCAGSRNWDGEMADRAY